MNDQLTSIIRSILKIGGGILIAKGIADNDQVEAIIAGVVAIVGVVWGITHHAPVPPTTVVTTGPTPAPVVTPTDPSPVVVAPTPVPSSTTVVTPTK